MTVITVIKRDHTGQEVWRYTGSLLERQAGRIVLEAFFDREDRVLQGMPLRRGDRFIETYYTDRWYNIFTIYAREDGALRGWYSNIGTPAEIQGETLAYTDLALDLLVFPDGRQVVLDEDEFAALTLPETLHQRARQALEELQDSFRLDAVRLNQRTGG
jgi:hypothetical protein